MCGGGGGGGVNSFLFLLTDGLLCVCVGTGGGRRSFLRDLVLLFLLFHLMHKWPGQIEIFIVDIKDIVFLISVFLLNFILPAFLPEAVWLDISPSTLTACLSLISSSKQRCMM